MLDKNQQKVVQYTEGPLLVIAGPGSGKTKTLVERSIHLLAEKKIEPSQIENANSKSFAGKGSFCFH